MSDLPAADPDCLCLKAPLPYDHYRDLRFIGVDETAGRFGQVWLRQCRRCGRQWLHYAVEYEHQTEAGRYFMGVITPEAAATMSPETALAYLDALDWHLYGGSYFHGQGRAVGKVTSFV